VIFGIMRAPEGFIARGVSSMFLRRKTHWLC
jgi:hypothetical protein